MRAFVAGLTALLALLFPQVGNAQAYLYGTPAPAVTAATADWQVQSAPIVVGGLIYLPTRAFRIFDANIMSPAGIYLGVPVYADVTMEPYSVMYVPVSPSNMRVYERRRDGALAGTTGSRTPSFPVEIASDTVLAQTRRVEAAALAAATQAAAASAVAGATGTTASLVPVPTATAGALPVDDRPRPTRTQLEVIPRVVPRGPNGVWLEFNGTRWYADGAAVPFSPDRFEPIGQYRGFLVYRDKDGKHDAIWVSVGTVGPRQTQAAENLVAPYIRR
jgi:hypothetical protein